MHGKNSPADIASHKIRVTFFDDAFASSLKTKKLTLAEIGKLVLETKAATKADLPWLKLARFGQKKKPKDDGTPGGPVAELVGIRVGVVSGVFNLESSGVEASDWRLRHEQAYHEA